MTSVLDRPSYGVARRPDPAAVRRRAHRAARRGHPRRLADRLAAARDGQHAGHRAARPAADRRRVGGDRAVQLRPASSPPTPSPRSRTRPPGSARRCSWCRPRTARPRSRWSRSRPPAPPTTPTRSTDLRETVRAGLPAGLTAQVTGQAPPSSRDIDRGVRRRRHPPAHGHAPSSALLLLITYRSPVLWIVPLLVVGVADRTASVVATQLLPLGPDVAGTTRRSGSVGPGLRRRHRLCPAADLPLSRTARRTRSGERRWPWPYAAPRSRPAQRGHGRGALLTWCRADPDHRGLGVAGALGILVAAAFAMVCCPRPGALPPAGVLAPDPPHGSMPTGSWALGSLWRRVGDRVAARPAIFVTGTLLLLAVMSLGLFRIETGLDQADQFLDKPEAISAPSGSPSRSPPAPSTRPRCSPATTRTPCWRPSRRRRRVRRPDHPAGERDHPDRRRARRRPGRTPLRTSCWRCATTSRRSTTRTSAAPRPSRSTSGRAPSGTGW